MLRLIAAVLLTLQPLAALARCEGTDLIAALPEAERAALARQAASAPYPKGLLWRARRSATTITLFGTYHFEHDRTAVHLEQLKPLIDAADAVFLEVSNDDQKALQHAIASDPSIMFIGKGDTLPDLLSNDEWKRLVQEMRMRSVPGFMAARFKPFWAAMMLGIGPCEARNGVMEGSGIDARIGDYAAAQGNPSRSLEDYRTLLTLFDSFPLDEQLDMIRLFLAWTGDADDLAYTLRQRYLTQQVALIWEFSRYISEQAGDAEVLRNFEILEQKLLSGRNKSWIDVLMRDAPGKQVFVAVGAAHLPGEAGVLRLLEQQGFAIERLPF